MDFHTDLLTDADLYDAKRAARVDFTKFEEKGSRTRLRRFVFLLEGYTSNRRPNWGTGERDLHDGFAATWDEWGIFLNVLFQRDPEAHTGTHGYMGLEGYQWQTGHRFDTLTRDQQHVNHRFNYDAGTKVHACKCGATRRWGNPDGLAVVKHGLVHTDDPESVNRWLTTTPVQRAMERVRELVSAA